MTVSSSQKPVGERSPRTVAGLLKIVCHPAFRLGFLDAVSKRPVDHDRIAERILAETPAQALTRLCWLKDDAAFDNHSRQLGVEIAQWRYEEGRLCVKVFNLPKQPWAHPDFPPKAVVALAFEMEKMSKRGRKGSKLS